MNPDVVMAINYLARTCFAEDLPEPGELYDLLHEEFGISDEKIIEVARKGTGDGF